MIKNYNFNISEEEKRQILNLHESRTKRHYLINEQKIPFNDAIELENVKKIQAQLGFTGADLDGKLGPKTLAAITAKLTSPAAEVKKDDVVPQGAEVKKDDVVPQGAEVKKDDVVPQGAEVKKDDVVPQGAEVKKDDVVPQGAEVKKDDVVPQGAEVKKDDVVPQGAEVKKDDKVTPEAPKNKYLSDDNF